MPKPVHVVPHGEQVAIFGDGDGTARVFDLSALTRRASAPWATLATGKPHHGVAVPMGNRVPISKADPASKDGALPSHVDVVDRAGSVVASTACPEMHGEIARDDWAAFACEDGIAVVTPGRDGTAPATVKLDYPAGATAERRAFTLHADAAGRRLIGNFGERSLVVIHRTANQARTIDVGARVASFAVDARSGAILALTSDGLLRRFDSASGRRTATRRVVGRAFTPAWDKPSPRLAVAGGLAVVSDHRRDRVTVLRTKTLNVVQHLRVPGAPTAVAIAGTLG